MAGRDSVFGDLVISVGVMVGYVGVIYFIFGTERGGTQGVRRDEVLVGRCLEGGGVVVRDFRFGHLVFFIGLMVVILEAMVGFVRVMVGCVGVIEIFGAKRGGERGVRRCGIYYVFVIIEIVYVVVF